MGVIWTMDGFPGTEGLELEMNKGIENREREQNRISSSRKLIERTGSKVEE